MDKLTNRKNFKVIVVPSERYLIGRDDEYCENYGAEEVRKAIKRHVDDVDSIDIEWETVCRFCGRLWETDDDGVPTCCPDAVSAHEKNRAERIEQEKKLNEMRMKEQAAP